MAEAERQLIPFEAVKSVFQKYLIEPGAENPTDMVNEFFRQKGGFADWQQEDSDEALVLLRAGIGRYRELVPSSMNPEHGTMGTITFGLPHFYPLQLSVLSWYVYGRMESAQSLAPEVRETVASEVLQQVTEFDVAGYDFGRHLNYVRRMTPGTEEIPISVAEPVEISRSRSLRAGLRAILSRFPIRL